MGSASLPPCHQNRLLREERHEQYNKQRNWFWVCAGVIVVEAEHTEDVRLLRPTSDLGHSDMLFAAMEAITKSDASKREFSDRVAAMVKVAHEQSGA